MGFPADWTHCFSITIDHTKVTGTPTGFVLFVTKDMLPTTVLDAGAFSAQEGGGDLRFTSDLAGATRLPCEVVDFHPDATSGNRRCEIHVNLNGHEPNTSTDTVIYGWCRPSPVRHQPAPSLPFGTEAVWSDLDYKLVAHLDDAADYVATGLWLIRPRAIEYNGATYITWLDRSNAAAQKLYAAKYTHSTGAWSSPVQVASALANDAHGSPTLCIDNSGNLYVFAAGYEDALTIKVWKSTSAESVSAWGSPVTAVTALNRSSYPSCVCLSNGHLVLFYRNGDPEVAKVVSTDSGATWGTSQSLATPADRPYFAVKLGASDRVHMAWHNLDTGSAWGSDLYYAFSDNADSSSSTWKASDGTSLSLPVAQPTTVAGGRVIHYITSWNKGGYLAGIAVNGSNSVRILTGLFDGTNTDKLAVFEYSASAWNQHDVVTSDSINVQPNALGESRSEGDVRFVSGTTWRAVFEINVSSKYEVQEYESTDDGATWAKVFDTTSGSSLHNTQPQYVAGTTGAIASVWWSCNPAATQTADSYNAGHDVWFAGTHTDNLASWAKAIGVTDHHAVCRDSSKYHGYLAKTNASTEATGLVGKAQSYNGTSNYGQGSDAAFPSGSSSMSLSAYFKSTQTAGATQVIAGYGTVTNGQFWWLFLNGSGFAGLANGTDATGSTNLAGDSTWHQGIGTWNGANSLIYIDKVQVGSGSPSPNIVPLISNVGDVGGSRFFKGLVDEARVLPAAVNANRRDTEYANATSPSTFASGADVTTRRSLMALLGAGG